ncbi:MAG TPA: DNA repair protein RecN, partial [Bacteroidales bacterium]|nr:DNA repair protein RecN [Bacteroidales bacterium]
SYAGIQVKTQEYRVAFSRFAAAKTRLSALEESEARSAADLDYHRFLLDELNAARPVDGEPEELEQKLTLLNHAEEIRENLAKAGSALTGDEENLLGNLAATIQVLNQAARFEPAIRTMAERLQSNYIDLKDLAGDILAEADRVETDPRLAEKLTQRLDLLNRLMKKHQVSDAGKLLQVMEELEKKVNGAAGREEEIRMLKAELEGMEKDLQARAAVLSKRRAGAIPGFVKEVTSLLEKLGIPRAQFRAELIDCQALSRDGLNRVSFLFSANKGIEMKDLGAAASGGELSRLMLAIKSMISQKNLLPTIIFDEIDNGVSGEVAGKVGSILRHMGSCMQVIAITHLPQIAAKGVRHYRVFKTEGKNTTHTYITEVEAGDRAVEIAKMLSDQRVTESAIKTANELLNN